MVPADIKCCMAKSHEAHSAEIQWLETDMQFLKSMHQHAGIMPAYSRPDTACEAGCRDGGAMQGPDCLAGRPRHCCPHPMACQVPVAFKDLSSIPPVSQAICLHAYPRKVPRLVPSDICSNLPFWHANAKFHLSWLLDGHAMKRQILAWMPWPSSPMKFHTLAHAWPFARDLPIHL